MKNVAIIGAGSWGTALALVAARAGQVVKLWAHSREVVEALHHHRENTVYLPGFVLPNKIEPVAELDAALHGAEIVVTVVPSHVCRAVYTQLAPHAQPHMIFANATKGLEIETQQRMEEVVSATLQPRFAPRYVMLSGPSFA
ncbi:MAG: NAD(P)-binding domain-containing protein, partial [Acidobacteria bacterium]|nr:NAD(P)-binding domain-containing protein [Acidobacteriota bacterium]